MKFFTTSTGILMVSEDDGTERDATAAEAADYESQDANRTGFDVVRRATDER